MSRLTRYEDRNFELSLGRKGDNVKRLCPECLRVRAHGSGCSKPNPIEMPITAKIPRATAHPREWKKLAEAYPEMEQLANIGQKK